ncbi:hypothetical protein EYC84_004860 [Monilinia fructicola]|uniref:Uncharacterized protein n=1 Tax=Monilinia fructicola TaxID=38448 RepID=A0A5M9K6C6_MONFR|nr:hypothetical protein EYC84_004860 [Monilinia fructicola]
MSQRSSSSGERSQRTRFDLLPDTSIALEPLTSQSLPLPPHIFFIVSSTSGSDTISVEQSITGNTLSPSEATPKATPPCMGDSVPDHDEIDPHEQIPSFLRLRNGIDMSDSHLNATITYLCRMVYPNDGDRLHTPSLILDEFLDVFSEICADEVDILPLQLANLKMLEFRIKEESAAILAAGAVNMEINGLEERTAAVAGISVYDEGPGDDDGSYYQCASDSEDNLYFQCALNGKTSSDEESSLY